MNDNPIHSATPPLIAELDWHGQQLSIDLSRGVSLAIPLDPHGPQPSFFAGAPAQARPLQVGEYIGDVSRGGSCNAEVLEFTPHCHGTHTECRAHLDRSAGSVLDLVDQQPCLARLVTLRGTIAAETAENYPAETAEHEFLLTRRELLEKFAVFNDQRVDALIIRTLPNPVEKMNRDYAEQTEYPVLSSEAATWLARLELKHLLIDTPSLDRANDGGLLSNHRTWWGMDGAIPPAMTDPSRRSVTEMIYVPDQLEDGAYWMHLELQPLVSDATSSRPILYPVTENKK